MCLLCLNFANKFYESQNSVDVAKTKIRYKKLKVEINENKSLL